MTVSYGVRTVLIVEVLLNRVISYRDNAEKGLTVGIVISYAFSLYSKCIVQLAKYFEIHRVERFQSVFKGMNYVR